MGEVDVRQSELTGLIKAAECLQIKGLAVPDEDPSLNANAKSNTHKKESLNSGNANNENGNKRREVCGNISPASQRKKQRRNSGGGKDTDHNLNPKPQGPTHFNTPENQRSSSLTTTSQISFSKQKNIHEKSFPEDLEEDEDILEVLPIGEIKKEKVDETEESQTFSESRNPLRVSNSDGDQQEDSISGQGNSQDNFSQFFEKQENEQLKDEYSDSIEAGPSGLQDVSFLFIISLKIFSLYDIPANILTLQ